jgi:hypothetical protein
LHADSTLAQDEQSLYKRLGQIMGKASGAENSMAELDGLPPFLPYLLSKEPKTPTDLLSEAMKHRGSPWSRTTGIGETDLFASGGRKA